MNEAMSPVPTEDVPETPQADNARKRRCKSANIVNVLGKIIKQ